MNVTNTTTDKDGTALDPAKANTVSLEPGAKIENTGETVTEFTLGVGPGSAVTNDPNPDISKSSHLVIHRSVWERLVDLAKRAEADVEEAPHWWLVDELGLLRDHLEHHQHEPLPPS